MFERFTRLRDLSLPAPPRAFVPSLTVGVAISTAIFFGNDDTRVVFEFPFLLSSGAFINLYTQIMPLFGQSNATNGKNNGRVQIS